MVSTQQRWCALPPDVLSPAVWRDLREVEALGEPGFIARLVTLFLDDAAERLRALERGVGAGDPPAVVREARALRRSADYVGALEMAGVAGVLEAVGQQGQLRYARILLTRLEQEFALVRGALVHV